MYWKGNKLKDHLDLPTYSFYFSGFYSSFSGRWCTPVRMWTIYFVLSVVSLEYSFLGVICVLWRFKLYNLVKLCLRRWWLFFLLLNRLLLGSGSPGLCLWSLCYFWFVMVSIVVAFNFYCWFLSMRGLRLSTQKKKPTPLPK